MSKKEFIENLLDKSKDLKDGIFFPNGVELKISELENFTQNVAEELSKIEEVIHGKEYYQNDKIDFKEEYKVKLIDYSIENDFIRFYPIILKNYLKKQQ